MHGFSVCIFNLGTKTYQLWLWNCRPYNKITLSWYCICSVGSCRKRGSWYSDLLPRYLIRMWYSARSLTDVSRSSRGRRLNQVWGERRSYWCRFLEFFAFLSCRETLPFSTSEILNFRISSTTSPHSYVRLTVHMDCIEVGILFRYLWFI
jgi:hypothetical protein